MICVFDLDLWFRLIFESLKLCFLGLLQMVQAFIAPTYAILSKPDGLRNHPGTVDDFFRLNARFMQRAPLAYLQVP